MKKQYAFMRENNIDSRQDLLDKTKEIEGLLARKTKHRTLLNVKKKKYAKYFKALANLEVLAPAKSLHSQGIEGFEQQAKEYEKTKALLGTCEYTKEELLRMKKTLYREIGMINKEIREDRKTLAMCKDIGKDSRTALEGIEIILASNQKKKTRNMER